VNGERGARVRVIDGEPRGRVGHVLAAPSATGTVYLRARTAAPTRQGLIAVRIDPIDVADPRGATGS